MWIDGAIDTVALLMVLLMSLCGLMCLLVASHTHIPSRAAAPEAEVTEERAAQVYAHVSVYVNTHIEPKAWLMRSGLPRREPQVCVYQYMNTDQSMDQSIDR